MTRLAPATALLCLLSAPALADITADDLWAAQVDMFARLGVTLKGDLNRDGSTVTVTGQSGEMLLPLSLGMLSWRASDTVMTEDGMGAVDIDLSAPQTWSLALHLTSWPEYDLTVGFTTTWTNAIGHASGTPDALQLSIVADRMDFTLGDFQAGPGYEAGDADADLFLTVTDTQMLLDIARGPLMKVVLSQRGTRAISDMAFRQGDMSTRSVIDQHESLGVITLMLPEAPLDLLDIGPALRAGFEAEVETRTMAMAGQTVAHVGGEKTSDDSQTAGPGNTFLRLAADGILMRGEQTDYAFTTDLSQLGIGSLGFSLAHGAGEIRLPLLAGQGEQAALFALDLTGMQADDAVWMLIGGAMAPEALHQPADLRVAIRATGEVLHDLTDVRSVVSRTEAGQAVFGLRGVSLDDLRVAYAGAELTGTGGLGWAQLQPLAAPLTPPTAQGDFVLTGAYALLDQLAQAGLLPPEGIAGVRAGLAAIGRPTGEDRLESSVAVDESGRVTVNGAPLPF